MNPPPHPPLRLLRDKFACLQFCSAAANVFRVFTNTAGLSPGLV